QTVIMEPSLRYQELMERTNYCWRMLGFELLVPRLKFNYRTWTLLTAVVSYTIFGIYWMSEQAKQSWTECLKASIMMGGMLSGSAELLTIILNQPAIRDIMHSTRSIFGDYEQRGADYCEALNQGINRLVAIMRLIRNGYMVSYTVMCSAPLIYLWYDGTRVTITQYELPGIPLENNVGFVITYLVQVLSMVLAGIGFYAGDMMGCLALMQILTFADILQLKSRDLNATLDRGKSIAAVRVHAQLVDFIKWHQLFTTYCHDVERIYQILFSGQVVSSAISILSTFCVILTEFHLISVIYFMVSAYSMSVYCVVGTKIEHAYDQVYDSICNVSWQELSAPQRKLFGLTLKEAQNAKPIIMLGILPLSVRTALQITKLIYSVSMMMMQNH
ncbi:hypothetical protein KR222_011832, partial [Zaprionus bogoriensis]